MAVAFWSVEGLGPVIGRDREVASSSALLVAGISSRAEDLAPGIFLFFTGYRSINITGDLRAVYKFINEEECIFVIIDTHSNLYS